jgi:hypothetical protein
MNILKLKIGKYTYDKKENMVKYNRPINIFSEKDNYKIIEKLKRLDFIKRGVENVNK